MTCTTQHIIQTTDSLYQNLYSASENDPELERYFYHTDLPIAIGMGSSSWITDASGDVFTERIL